MNSAGLIMVVGLGIASMAFVFMFLILREVEVNEERIAKILGEDLEKIKKAKDDEELKEIIRSLPKNKRTKLKTLFESQDIRVAVNEIKKHILKVNPPEN